MKNRTSPAPIVEPHRLGSKLAASLSLAALFCGGALHAQTTSVSWLGGTSTDWTNNNNWSSALANDTTSDVAVFNGSPAYQPSLATDTLQSIAGIQFTGTPAAVTISAPADSSLSESAVTAANSNSIILNSLGSLTAGEMVTDASGYIPAGTYIQSINASNNTITLSNNTTASIPTTGDALKFTPTLTIGSSGVTMASTVANNEIISAPIVIGASQTWTNNSSLSFESTTNVNIASGQTLTLAGKQFIIAGANGLTGAGTLNITGKVLIGQPGAAQACYGNSAFAGTITLGSAGTLEANGGTGTVSGNETDVLGGPNSTLIINAGTFTDTGNMPGIATSAATIATSPNAALFGGSQQWSGSFALNTNNKNLLFANGSIAIEAPVTVTLTDTHGTTAWFGGPISGGAANTLTVAASNAGDGLGLTGVSTYTGNTIIKSGIVYMANNGSINSSSTIVAGDISGSVGKFDVSQTTTAGGYQIVSGQTLSGFGTIQTGSTALTIATGATIAAGNSTVANSIGKLTVTGTNSSALLSIQGTYLWSLGSLKDDSTGTAGTDFSQIVLTGTQGLSLTGGQLNIQFANGIDNPNNTNDSFWQTDHTWTIMLGGANITNAGTQFSGITDGAYTDGSFGVSADSTGDVTLTYLASVPEPQTWAATLVGAFGLLVVRRRLRQRDTLR